MRRLVIVLALLAGCTDAERASFSALGEPARVTCWSGGVLTYQGHSTGRVSATSNSDGWEFRDAETQKFIRVSGDCLVEN